MIYLDNAATTVIDEEVLEEMLPFFKQCYGNPGATYSFGGKAKHAVDTARERVAEFFNCDPENIIFTSGGSEGNNMVIQSVCHDSDIGFFPIISTTIEHDSVLRAIRAMEYLDLCSAVFIDPDRSGRVNPEELFWLPRGERLVSIMHTNNETGVTNDIPRIGEFCRERGFLLHTDCVQAAGSYDLDVDKLLCDFAVISGHKIHGPKGVGAVYVRDISKINPLIFGGNEQEFGRRGGTENVPGIVGLGKACEISKKKVHEIRDKISILHNEFLRNISIPEGTWRINGEPDDFSKTINLMIDGVDSQALLLALDMNDICASAGSACCSREITPSHVLKAMGLTDSEANSSIRVSFSKNNTEEEVAKAAKEISRITKELRELRI